MQRAARAILQRILRFIWHKKRQ